MLLLYLPFVYPKRKEDKPNKPYNSRSVLNFPNKKVVRSLNKKVRNENYHKLISFHKKMK